MLAINSQQNESMDEEPESESTIEAEDLTPQDNAHLEIQHVAESVDNIQSNIRQLADTANKFSTGDYSLNLASAQDFLDKLGRQCLQYEEDLMQVI